MIQVKICGITSREDALCAAQNGAAAVGFIFYQLSPRAIDAQKATEIISYLPETLVKVGVFVNAEADLVKRIYDYCRLDMIQLHGDESPRYCQQFPPERVIKALELKNEEDVKNAAQYQVAAILADSRQAGLYGGTGKLSNWDLAARLSQPLILSGGLQEENVLAAAQKVCPAALDINSGVESAPGKKDHKKIKQIMQMIKNGANASEKFIIFTRRED